MGLVGCGSIADTLEDVLRDVPGWPLFPYSHASTFEGHERTALVAIAEPNPDRREIFARRWEVPSTYPSIEEMLGSEELDIVAIASPTGLHAAGLMAAVASGVRGVFLEKPVACTLRDADEMIDAAEANGVSVVVNHFRSFEPGFRQAGRLISDGEIGDVVGVLASWGEGLSQGGCHLFDLLRMTLDRAVEWVTCDLEDEESHVDPGAHCYLHLAGEIGVHVHMPWRSRSPIHLEFLGTQGAVRISNFERRLWRYEDVNERVIPVEWPFFSRDASRSGMLVALDELIAAMEGGPRPSSGLPEGREALEITAALLLAGRTGGRVSLPFDDRDFVVKSWL